jgi:hypothetical protein
MMSFLRDQWELELQKAYPSLENKRSILARLNELLLLGQVSLNGDKDLRKLSSQLHAEQEELKSLFLLPHQEEMWLRQKIRPKWDVLLSTSVVWDNYKEEILQLVDRLEKAFWIVLDQGLAGNMEHLPAELKNIWPKIAYTQFSAENRSALEGVLNLLDHPKLNIQHKQQVRKALSSMKVVVDTIARVEDQTNRVLYSLKNGEADHQDALTT